MDSDHVKLIGEVWDRQKVYDKSIVQRIKKFVPSLAEFVPSLAGVVFLHIDHVQN